MKDTAERIVDSGITLIPYYRNDEVSLEWYQDRDLVKMVDNRDTPYDIHLLHRMYDYLSFTKSSSWIIELSRGNS